MGFIRVWLLITARSGLLSRLLLAKLFLPTLVLAELFLLLKLLLADLFLSNLFLTCLILLKLLLPDLFLSRLLLLELFLADLFLLVLLELILVRGRNRRLLSWRSLLPLLRCRVTWRGLLGCYDLTIVIGWDRWSRLGRLVVLVIRPLNFTLSAVGRRMPCRLREIVIFRSGSTGHGA